MQILFSLSEALPTLTWWLRSYPLPQCLWQVSHFLPKGLPSLARLERIFGIVVHYRARLGKAAVSGSEKRSPVLLQPPYIGCKHNVHRRRSLTHFEILQYSLTGFVFTKALSLIYWGAFICPVGSGLSQTCPELELKVEWCCQSEARC